MALHLHAFDVAKRGPRLKSWFFMVLPTRPNHEQEAGAAYKKKRTLLAPKKKKIYQELGWIGSLDDERDSRLVLLSSSSLDCCVRACDCDPWER